MSRKGMLIIAVVVAAAVLGFSLIKFSGKFAGEEAHVICPVCQMKVDPATAPKSAYKNRNYYFCSQAHKDEFDAAPGRYAEQSGIPK
jgi:YHS domain-containing protein